MKRISSFSSEVIILRSLCNSNCKC